MSSTSSLTSSSEFNCPLCNDVLKDAVITRCGHTFCDGCVRPSLSTKPYCPQCGMTEYPDNLIPNTRVNEMVAKYASKTPQTTTTTTNGNNNGEVGGGKLEDMSPLEVLNQLRVRNLNADSIDQLISILQKQKQTLGHHGDHHGSNKTLMGDRGSSLSTDFLTQLLSLKSSEQDNKTKVYYGLLREPDLQNFQVEDDDDDGDGGGSSSKDKDSQKGGGDSHHQKGDSQGGEKSTTSSSSSSKKKKGKKDWLSNKKSKNDPNAPPITRMPLPELRDIDKIEKAKAQRESTKRVTLGPDRLPSVCFYTVLNGDHQVTFVKWSEDGTLMGVGFASSLIRIWSLTTAKLKKMKPASELQDIDREADDVFVRMMDDRSAEPDRCLRGHCGPVYSIDFSPDKLMLLSSSEDGNIRLWSLLTWTCLVVYKGHLFPVWKAVFSPHGGYYFASAGHDRTARLWATDTPQALRIFAGHHSDVTAILFHPNSNYVATGSADRSVRLWDCVSGSCVRLMSGHKGSVQALCFSVDGRFLVSSATDKKVMVWDMANGGLVTILHAHKDIAYSLAFSREGNLLATGGLDHCVRLWNFVKIVEDVVSEEGGATIPPDVRKISGDNCSVGDLYTKNTNIFALHFTRRNILLASGPYVH